MRTPVLALLGGLLAASSLVAQTSPKPGTARAPAYDAKAEVTLAGVIEALHTSLARADHPGLHLMLKTDTETVEVHTCPVRFMRDLEFGLQKGDAVTVIGSRPDGGGIVLAREIQKGQISLTIRDKTGAPVWTR